MCTRAQGITSAARRVIPGGAGMYDAWGRVHA